MPEPTLHASPAPIDADILCVKCHYNLRGLDTDKRCPECGLLIAVSLPTRRAVSIPEWMSIRRALLFILIANLSIPPIAGAAAIASFILPLKRNLILWPAAAPILALVLLRTLGYARLAAVDRGFDRSPLEWEAHRAVSSMAWLRAAIAPPLLLFAILYLTLDRWQHDIGAITPLLGIAGLAYAIAGALQFAGLQYLLSRLGYRTRIPNLGTHTTHHAGACVALAFVAALTAGIFSFLPWLAYHALLARFFWLASERTRDHRSSTAAPAT